MTPHPDPMVQRGRDRLARCPWCGATRHTCQTVNRACCPDCSNPTHTTPRNDGHPPFDPDTLTNTERSAYATALNIADYDEGSQRKARDLGWIHADDADDADADACPCHHDTGEADD
jgi:hypothetical protein